MFFRLAYRAFSPAAICLRAAPTELTVFAFGEEQCRIVGARSEFGAHANAHRSRIVRLDQIVELVTHENGQYAIKLRDGSQHRSSRTYTQALEAWLHSQRDARKRHTLGRDRSIGTVNYRSQLTRAIDRG